LGQGFDTPLNFEEKQAFMQRILWLFIVFLVLSPAAWAQTLRSIRVEGNKRIETDAILEKMSLKIGDALTRARVASDIRNIFSLGFFEDIRFSEEQGVLTVTVKERPVVTEIVYVGSEEFQEKDLQEASGLKPFNVLNLDKVRLGEEAIVKKYEEKGYYLARAETRVEPIEGRENEVRLKVQITENQKVIVRKIFFMGNKVFPESDLKRVMLTSEGHVFSWATGGGTYRESAFERDLAALAYFYGDKGYIEAKFGKPRVTLSQDRRYIDVILDVNEGEQFYLGEVRFQGDDLFTEEDLRKSFMMKEGDVFSTGTLQQQILALTDKYGDEGYAFANVIPRTAIDPATRKVNLDIQIEKGEKVYWGKIHISGNTKTHDKVIRRELRFKEGELYNATKRKKSLERVLRLGFFGNDVNFLTSSPEGSTNILDLEVRVEEKPSGTLVVQAGYGNAVGFSFGAQISQANLLGRGQQLSFNLNLSSNSDQTFNLQFTDPKINDSEWLAGFDLYVQKNGIGGTYSTYEQRLKGTSVRVGREIYEDLNLFASYKFEHYRLQNPINPNIFTNPALDMEANISSITSILALDRRNNRLDPSDGYYLSASSEFAGLGGRVFQKFNLAARYYQKVWAGLVYRTNLEYGVLTNFITDETVPDAERFVLGGVSSLRGYPSASVGPTKLLINTRDKKADGSLLNPNAFNYTFGGTQKLLYINELETPLIPDANIRLAFFLDIGNAWDGNNMGSPSLLSNYGWGIRWYSPLGPLRFEWGYPLTTTPSKPDKGVEFHFIIAPTF
jgi:outer membrane protein insertion porin family